MTLPAPTVASGVASPCTNVCRLDAATGWCEGCRRTLTEITEWSMMSDAAKRSVWNALAHRDPPPPAADTEPRR